jgi:hypothetical protein
MRRRSFHLLLVGVIVLPLILAAIVGIWMGVHREEPETAVVPSPTASLPPARQPATRPSENTIGDDAEDAAAEPSAPE